MKNIKKWFHTMTLGQTGKYLKILAWNFFDSFVVSIPYAVMLTAIYLLLIPMASPNTSLPINRLWILCGVLLAQFIGYNFLRRKTYIDFCVGFASTTKTSRLTMGEHLRRLGMGFFNHRDAGDLSTVLLRDYAEIENLSQQLLPQVATITIRFVLAAIVLSAFDWRMILAVFIVIPLALPFVFISYRKANHIGAQLQQAQQDASSGILEYVGGILTLKAFHMAGEQFETLKSSLDRQRRAAIGLETGAAAPVSMIGRFVLNCGIALVMLLGGSFVADGSLSPFYYIAFLVLTLTIYDPILILFTFIADFTRTTRSGRRIEALFAEEPLPEPYVEKKAKNMEITFDHVSFSYGSKEVLHNISLCFPKKSVTALVGPSGSGKSTITRLAARFWDATGGEVRLGGIPVKDMKTDELLSHISMVFQDVYLFHDTIEGNIRMGKSDATHDEIIAAAKAAACHDFIMALPNGYQTVVGEGGSTLSGGEKQRISIARALLKDAPIVLLDEATASLDPENEVLIQQALSALVAEKTVIVIAHRLQSISNADQIIVLEDGCIRESGSHEQLLAKGSLYATLWEEQNKAGSWQIYA
ncbi:ABC transporter ATP-binding protein [Konateibacter massiliensis]|uniref:ABC transporter ATP-binding protein n=1 Tax=Konateibacter massiliensis TaxID=2002841 RepID=UPI0015D4E655|nr:ABC transporter ATP-binding protein [Konateibacter massiliensis]